MLLLRNFDQLPTDGPDEFCWFSFIRPREGHFEAKATKQRHPDIYVDYQFDRYLNIEFALPSAPLTVMLENKFEHPPTDAERRRLYLKELGDVRVLKNEFAHQ